MGLSYKKIRRDIRRKNYTEAPLRLPEEALEKAALHFLSFLTLPQHVKDEFAFMLNEKDRGSNAGYARKLRSKGDSDNKEYFNYRRVTKKVLAKPIRKYRKDARVLNFMDSADAVLEGAVEALRLVMKALDTRHPGAYRKIFSKRADELLCLRFVKYDPSADRRLAVAHYDRSACTLAVAESAPGLRIGRDERRLRSVRRSGATALFFPSIMFRTVIPSKQFPPAWHDVIQKKSLAYSARVARWSIVLFADTDATGLSYADAHTPKQY